MLTVSTNPPQLERLIQLFGVDKGKAVYDLGSEVPDHLRDNWYDNLINAGIQGSVEPVKPYIIYKQTPVDIKTFIEDPYYLNKKNDIYPVLLDELIQLNSGDYEEAIFTGGIGAGKSTGALYTQLYQLYLMSCMKDPHKSFDLDPSSEIVIAFQSINLTIAKKGDYGRFKHMVEMSPYFKEHFPFDKNIDSRLLFPHRIEVLPISGLETAAIGQNIISAVLEEVNFMAKVERSKKSIDGDEFDQAAKLYNSISKRRDSRFLAGGKLPGILCIVSSKRYPGQFTDIKEAEAKKQQSETGKTKIYVYDKRMWEVKPSAYSGVTFQIFIGDESRKPRILTDADSIHPKDRHLIDNVPIEFKHHFERDMITSLRDIAGKSTLATSPFILNTESISTCMDRNDSIFSSDSVDFVDDQLFIIPDNFKEPNLPRYAHIDLGITGDSAGLVIGTVTGFTKMSRAQGESGEILPTYHIDGCLEVRPPKGGEINFEKIRSILYILRDQGLNIRWVSLDSFQSRDSLQILRSKGFFTGMVSMDTSMLPYEITKRSLYDSRISMPFHEKLRKELASLEFDAKRGKIDHPSVAGASKDCSDALAGVIYGLINRREVWGHFGISPTEIPDSIKRAPSRMDSDVN